MSCDVTSDHAGVCEKNTPLERKLIVMIIIVIIMIITISSTKSYHHAFIISWDL